MTITINIDTILFLLALLGCATLIALILLLKKLTAFISSVDALLAQNSTNVGLAISKIPAILENVDSVTDNAKEVSEVAADISNDISTAKETVKNSIIMSAGLAAKAKDHFKKD
jgi:hypothetical protein